MKINESNLKFKKLVYTNNPNKIIYHHTEATKATIEDIHRWAFRTRMEWMWISFLG
ncbi:hypothetical protein [Clostridium cochlearium]|uniref:Putative N-acetylmuramoyl-L-alanine amidase n=1 Tax=Clostridium cochlearium TaxID=1494 RepID=A0A2X2WBS4_CLOCO|nr:hypothetical protein [Clostridium cochlearium]SQB33495.1 putative N-acetylmuramoyl-L-alanine amidase [Clostridium cochlearium]